MFPFLTLSIFPPNYVLGYWDIPAVNIKGKDFTLKKD